MLLWFLLALGSAVTNSGVQATQKLAVSISRYSKLSIAWISAAAGSLILFSVSYFFVGLPEIDSRFWIAVLVTGVLNAIAFPIMLKAYELGEFSSVYSMILLTPVFLLFTSIIFLGEIPSLIGVAGVILTVAGLWVTTRINHKHVAVPNFATGNLLGVLVAFIWSITVNFDKLAALYSDRFFSAAAGLAIVSVGNIIFLMVKYRKLLLKTAPSENNQTSGGFLLPGIVIVLALGALMSFSNVVHNSALLAGSAPYTIAIKRMGVLFGIFWGWLFFHEKDIAKKIFGAAIAIGGVVMILFS